MNGTLTPKDIQRRFDEAYKRSLRKIIYKLYMEKYDDITTGEANTIMGIVLEFGGDLFNDNKHDNDSDKQS